MTLALGLTVIRVSLILLNSYKEDLAATISEQLAAPVTIESITTGMRKFKPELVLRNLAVQSINRPQSNAITIAQIHLNINLLRSLTHQQLLASSWITLVGAKFTLNHQKDGRIGILGLANDPNQPAPFWLFNTAQIEILDTQVGWQEENQTQLMFKDVDISLINQSNGLHRLNLLTSSPKELAEKLQISMLLQGNFFEPNSFNGLIYANIKKIPLANPYTRHLPLEVSINGGQGDIELWGQWQQSTLQSLTGKIHLERALMQRPAKPPLLITQFSNNFRLTQQNQKWTLVADNVTLKSQGNQITDALLSAQGSLNQDSTSNDTQTLLEQLQIETKNIELEHATQLQAFFSPIDFAHSSLKTLRGQLQNVWLQIQPLTQQFALRANFDHVSLEANADVPGITNLKGYLHGTQKRGVIHLDTQNSVLNLPNVFANPLPLESINAHFTWRQKLTGWYFECPKVAVNVPDIKVNSQFKLNIDKETFATTIDLTSAFLGASDVSSFARYLPVGTMGKDAANWLNQAFLKGQIKPTGVILKGKLTDFPFRNQAGVFQIALELVDVELNFTHGWKPLEKLNGEVLFFQEGMQVVAREAAAKDFKFAQLGMQLKSFEYSDFLTVSGSGKGDLLQILDYLKESPLKPKITHLLDVINPKGPSGLSLELQVPLTDKGNLKLTGAAELQDVYFNVLPLDLPVTKTHGTLEFSEIGLTQGSLEAEVLGYQAKSTLKGGSDKLQLDIVGHTHIDDLKAQFELPLWKYAKGETDYALKLILPNPDDQHTQLHLTSTLKGLALTLPDALAKQSGEARSFDLSINFNDPGIVPLSLNYMQQLQAALDFDFKNKKISSGHVLIGDGKLDTSTTKGMYLNVQLKHFSPDDWLTLADNDASSSTKALFDEIHLNTDHLLWHQQDAGALQLRMHQDQQNWQISADSPLLKGSILKPLHSADDSPMILNLDYLDLSGLSKLKSAKPEQPTSRHLPLFRIKSEQVLWNKVNLGKLTLDTQRITNGIEFKKVALINPHGILELTGNWIFNATEQLTTTLGKLTMQDFGSFLEQLDFTNDLKDTQALVELAVNWTGAPQDFALEKLDGRVDIDLKNGRILSIEPGFGRVLGFLAMEQWGRRLRLDFSDMIAQGLTFNSITGHFDLQKGNAVTDSLKIDAIPATINLSGSTYLPEHALKLHVAVLPKSSAAVPIAGTIVDKVLTFAVETVTGTSQEGFLMGSEYKLRGNWQNPEVTQLHEHDGLLPKTWSGLTDFSWLTKTPDKKK